tara:strand:+ start:1453 stop:2184 length:732 start_codon:yes stop_codon:yes gene_type:complete
MIPRRVLGYFAIAACVIIWVASSQIIKLIFEDESYSKPFAITYFSCSIYTLFLLGFLFPTCKLPALFGQSGCKHICEEEHDDTHCHEDDEDEIVNMIYGDKRLNTHVDCHDPIDMAADEEDLESIVARVLEEVERVEKVIERNAQENVEIATQQRSCLGKLCTNENKLDGNSSTYDIFLSACIVCPAWFLSQYFYNLSLEYTSVSSNTILSSTSGVWTLLLSAAFGIDEITKLKVHPSKEYVI